MKGVSSDYGDLTFLKGERERKGIQGGSLGLQQVPRKFHWNYPTKFTYWSGPAFCWNGPAFALVPCVAAGWE